MNKFFKFFKVRTIEVYVYRKESVNSFDIEDFPYVIDRVKLSKNKIRYYILVGNTLVHESYLYKKIFLMRLLQKKNPVIGDCFTNSDFRGQSIYPYVINHIANEVISSEGKDVYIIVNTNNFSSIKGIEKARFEKYAEIKAKRWTLIYFKKKIHFF